MPTLTSKTHTQPLFRLDSADGEGKCPKCQAELESGKCPTASCSEHDDQQTMDGCQKTSRDEECDKCGKKDGCSKPRSKAKGDSAPVLRVDWGSNDPWSQDSDWGMTNVKPLTKTDNGSLIGRACITNVGVFTYYNADGTATHELRPEEEVMHPDSLASMALLPVTNLHPSVPVTPENVEQFQVGSTGDGIRSDAMRVFAPVSITKQEGLEAVAAGRRGLSVGYKTLVVDTAQTYPNGKTYPCPGVWMGVRYDRIQTKIRGNHLALVDIPRAGDDAYLRMDGVGVEAVKLSTNQPNQHRRDDMPIKIKLDGQSAEYEVAEPVKVRIDALEASEAKLTQDLADKSKELSAATAKVDSLTSDLEKARRDAADAVKAEKEKLDGAVSRRLGLIAQATKYGVTLKGDENDAGIVRAITLAAYPDAGPKLDSMDETYAAGRFDSAVDSLEAALKNDGDQASHQQRADGADFVPGGQPVAPTTLAQKADAYTAALNEQWKQPVGSVKKPS